MKEIRMKQAGGLTDRPNMHACMEKRGDENLQRIYNVKEGSRHWEQIKKLCSL